MFGRVDLSKIATEIVRFKSDCMDMNIWTEPKAALSNLPDYCRFERTWPKDGQGQWEVNIELRRFLNAAWRTALANSDRDRLFELSRWIVRDWGGIQSIKDETVLVHLNDAISGKYVLPFEGISSKSKVLSVAHPEDRQIYDARVAVALNIVQKSLSLERKFYFKIPSTQITWIAKAYGGHEAIFPSSYYVERGYEVVARKEIYAFYSILVPKLAVECDLFPIEVEMALFAAAEQVVPLLIAEESN